METHDLDRKKITRDLPTHPPDPEAVGDEGKVVNDGGAVRTKDYNDPPPTGGGKSTGNPLDDDTGGPGLGTPPSADNAAGQRDAETRADDVQDGRSPRPH